MIPEKMAKLIEQPEQFKAELKDKWLDYYEANRNWLQPLIHSSIRSWQDSVNSTEYKELEDSESNYYPCHPNSYFILGVVSILEPEIQGLCNFVSPSNPDELVSHLGLDFDPEMELKKRPEKEITPAEYLDIIREEIKT